MKDMIALIIITIISTIIVFEIARRLLKLSRKEALEFFKDELHRMKLENACDGIENFAEAIFGLVQVFFWLILLGIALTFLVALIES